MRVRISVRVEDTETGTYGFAHCDIASWADPWKLTRTSFVDKYVTPTTAAAIDQFFDELRANATADQKAVNG